jgi:hypothetical protein
VQSTIIHVPTKVPTIFLKQGGKLKTYMELISIKSTNLTLNCSSF